MKKIFAVLGVVSVVIDPGLLDFSKHRLDVVLIIGNYLSVLVDCVSLKRESGPFGPDFLRLKGFIVAIDSSSTLLEVIAEYKDNADWEGNLTKAAAFLKACRYSTGLRKR